MYKLITVIFVMIGLVVASSYQKELEEIQTLYKISHLLKGESNVIPKDEFDLNSVPVTKKEYDAKRKQLIQKDRKSYFTVDVPELTYEEKIVEEKLFAMRKELVYADHSPMLLNFYDGKKIIQDSDIHNVFKKIPKGGHLHLHIEAAVPMDVFMNFTTEDYVYYNMEKNQLRTAPKGLNEEGFKKWNELRSEWEGEGTFDDYLVSKLLLQPEEIKSRESQKIWDSFQYKFMLNDGVIHYYKFYKEGIKSLWRKAKSEGIDIVEIRHASGIIFNDDGDFLSYKDEFDLYQETIDEIREEDPDFEFRLIVVAFKVMGKEAVRKQLESYQFAMDNNYTFITGFDLVNEEDSTEPIVDFVDDMLEAKKGYPDFSFYFHAGESSSRFNENLYDAVLLDSKRIGHGIGTELHPYLTQLIKERNIGYEICPISNFILGYTLDMRWHPVRTLMASGIAVTLNSDDPTFWGYNGLSLDFTYAFLAWQLDLKDIKQMAINSIKQSSVEQGTKDKLLKKFHIDFYKAMVELSKELSE